MNTCGTCGELLNASGVCRSEARHARKFTADEVRATRQKIASAGLALVAQAPHFGLAWAKMRPRAQVPSATQGGTWEVDRTGVLYADPKFTATLADKEAQFILAHEIMHVLADHHSRAVALGLVDERAYVRPGREAECEVWNWACDMAINYALKRDEIGTCPEHALLPPDEYIQAQFPLYAESIYFWLLKQMKGGQSGQSGGAGGQGQPKPGKGQPGQGKGPQGQGAGGAGAPLPGAGCAPVPGKGDGQGKEPGQQGAGGQGGGGQTPIDWNDVRREVEACARQLGGKFAGRGSAVADLLAPTPSRVDWRKLCRQGYEHVSSEAEERSRRSFSRLARRPELVAGILRPGHIGTEGTLAGVCDVSGSISREQVAQIAGHMLKLCKQFPQVKVIFVAHTDRVEFAQVLKPGGDLASIMKGLKHTGGTRVQPAYDKVLELNKGKKVDNLIHFTDGFIENPWPEVPAKRFIVGQVGSGDGGTPKPDKARVVPVALD